MFSPDSVRCHETGGFFKTCNGPNKGGQARQEKHKKQGEKEQNPPCQLGMRKAQALVGFLGIRPLSCGKICFLQMQSKSPAALTWLKGLNQDFGCLAAWEGVGRGDAL